MKKNICKILFTIVCMFMTVGLIVADNDYIGGNAGGDAASGGGQTDPSNEVVSDGLGNQNYTIGIRLMFYTSSGQKIHAQDYVAQQYVNQTIYTQYGTGTPCGKIDNCALGAWTLANNVKSINELTNALGVNVHNVLANKSLAKEKLFSTFLNAQSIDKAKQIISPIFPYNIDNYYNAAADAYDLFIVWEPLGIIKDKRISRNMIGTSRELVAEVKNMDASGAKYLYNGNDIGAWGGLGNAVTKYMGCSAFLEYELDFGRRVNQKFRSFTETSYFNGKLNLLNSFSSTECKNTDKNILATLANNNSSDYAVGVLWFDDYDEGPGGVTCQNVYDYYGGKDNICNTIKLTGNFGFSAFNNKIRSEGKTFPVGAEGGITLEWYNANCGCGPDNNGIDCTPTYNVPSCTTGDNKTLTYKDSTDWEHCIFTDENIINGVSTQNKYTINPHKWSNKNQNLTYYDKNLSSENGYCDVYCIEEVYGNFDSNNPTVLAGNHFTWGWSQVQTVRTCKTNGINIEKFERDLSAANEEVVQQIANNKLYKSLSGYSWHNMGDKYTGSSDTVSFLCSNCDGKDHCGDRWKPLAAQGYSCSYSGTGCSHSFTCTKNDRQYSCTNYSFYKDVTCTVGAGINECSNISSSCRLVYTVQNGNNSETRTYHCYPPRTSVQVTVADISKTANFSTDVCVTTQPSGPSSPKLQDAINKVNSVINDFKKCYEFDNTNVLNDQSKATISYISPNNIYDYSGEMEKSTNTIYNEGTCTLSKRQLTLNGCSSDATDSSHCPTNTIYTNLYNCDSHTEIGDSTTDFSLKGDIYQYVIKNPNDLTLKSVHTSSFRADYENATTYNYESRSVWKYNWTDIGYSNFPIPFIAESKSYSGNLQIEYSNIGHTSTPGSTNVDTILKSVPSYGQYGNWSCGYDVEYDFIEDNDDDDDGPGGGPGDINVIYREIDLYNPFPDTNSRGRHTGANWCSHENCDYDSDNVVVNSYILQNRNVEGDDVYNLDPMYTFVMTPSDIIKIRRYNDNNTYSSYEGTLGGKKYAFTCTRGSLRNCRSDYLSELITMLDDSTILPGSCKGDRQVYQGDTASSQFESCRY